MSSAYPHALSGSSNRSLAAAAASTPLPISPFSPNALEQHNSLAPPSLASSAAVDPLVAVAAALQAAQQQILAQGQQIAQLQQIAALQQQVQAQQQQIDAAAAAAPAPASVPSASSVSLASVLNTGVAASARRVLERFCHQFTDKHSNDPAFIAVCSADLANRSNTSILEHFEQCPAVTHDEHLLLGDQFGMEITKKKIRLSTTGSLAMVYNKMSEIIHSDCIRTNGGDVIVPASLSNREKRFLLRFLLANGHDVMILQPDGTLRKPFRIGEIETPPQAPDDAEGSASKKRKSEVRSAALSPLS